MHESRFFALYHARSAAATWMRLQQKWLGRQQLPLSTSANIRSFFSARRIDPSSWRSSSSSTSNRRRRQVLLWKHPSQYSRLFSSTVPRPSPEKKSDAATTRPHVSKDSTQTSDKDNLDDETATKFHPPQATTSDPPILTWVDHYLPNSWQPYARLARVDKPIGTWLLLWPCAWSTALAASPNYLPDISLLTIFAVGAFTMRGAGCTINDMWDRDVDAAVSRTQTRPLAAGDITMNQAWGFLAAQLTTGLAVLVSLPHTWYCFQWGVASLPLVAVYPTMKRFFPYPQLVLGLTFNWGAWMGWAATYGSMDYSIIGPLYLSGVTWTLVYDTIYAHQDKRDDSKLGLQSTALTFGANEQHQKWILHGLAALTAVNWAVVGFQAELSPIYYMGAMPAYLHLVWQIHTADFENPHNVADRFRSNSMVGGMMFGSIVAGNYFM